MCWLACQHNALTRSVSCWRTAGKGACRLGPDRPPQTALLRSILVRRTATNNYLVTLSFRIKGLLELRGKAVVEQLKAQVMAVDCHCVVQELLVLHYDPAYRQSIEQNFSQHGTAS